MGRSSLHQKMDKVLEFARCGVYHNYVVGKKRDEFLKMIEEVEVLFSDSKATICKNNKGQQCYKDK